MKKDGLASVINSLWIDYQCLAASHLLSAEESEAMAGFVREMRDLQERLESGQSQGGIRPNGEPGHLELEGMISVFRNDIRQVVMRISA